MIRSVQVWVCTSCGRVWGEPRPTIGRGGQDASNRHKVYTETTPGVGRSTFKLGPWTWCGPVEQWIARPS